MPRSSRRPQRATVSPSVAAVLIGASAFVAFALAPGAVAQVGDLSSTDPEGGLGGAGLGPIDGVLDDLGFPGGLVTGIAITLGVVFLSVAISFLGGTKFVNSENVLDNDARRSIFEHVRDNPGSHLRATAQALELSTTNVLWHLRKLEAANLVASKKFEGYKVFYPVEGGVESRRRALAHAVLRNDNAQQILEYILGSPSAHQREIARQLGVNHGTIRWHLRKLTDAGLLLQVKKDAASNYYVSELGLQLLGELGNAQAKAHVSGESKAPGAAVPASIAIPVSTAQTARTAGAHAHAAAYAGGDRDE